MPVLLVARDFGFRLIIHVVGCILVDSHEIHRSFHHLHLRFCELGQSISNNLLHCSRILPVYNGVNKPIENKTNITIWISILHSSYSESVENAKYLYHPTWKSLDLWAARLSAFDLVRGSYQTKSKRIPILPFCSFWETQTFISQSIIIFSSIESNT